MSLIIFVILLCTFAVLLYSFCDWMAPGTCRVEGIGKLGIYSSLTGFSGLLSLTLSPNSSFDFSRHHATFIHGNTYSDYEIF